jgi:hypothetical protein
VISHVAVRSPRHVPVVGGIAAWSVPLITAVLGLGGVGLGLLEFAVAAGVVGFVAQGLLRSVVVEISERGLARGFILNGRFLGGTTVMPWHTIASVHTDWRRSGDDTALATTVRDREGRAIHFTTTMGLWTFRECLVVVVDRALDAERSGLTETLLSEELPGPRAVLSAATTTGALALVILALVGIHYVWARGPSTVERYLDGPPPVRLPADR